MRKTGVLSARVDEVDEAELANSPEALKLGRLKQFDRESLHASELHQPMTGSWTRFTN